MIHEKRRGMPKGKVITQVHRRSPHSEFSFKQETIVAEPLPVPHSLFKIISEASVFDPEEKRIIQDISKHIPTYI